MRKIFKCLSPFLLAICLSALTTVPALAAEQRFADIPTDAPYFEAVEYMAERGITVGTGGNSFSPEVPITVRQWAVMLCRAFDRTDALNDTGDFGSNGLTEAYRSGWFSETAVLEPDTQMCRGALYESAYAAIGLPVYDYALYPGRTILSTYDNCLRIGMELSLCPEDTKPTEIVTRGEAAMLLHALLTQEYQIAEPPMLTEFPIQNNEDVNMNDYLLALQSVPEPILQAFQEQGWTYVVDFEYLAELSQQLDMNCIGATSYTEKRIYIAEASSTLHEFGHFLDYALGRPSQSEGLYEAESAATTAFLRGYAWTNCREYFADCFTYWLNNHENAAKMELFQKSAPGSFGYFDRLAADGWL